MGIHILLDEFKILPILPCRMNFDSRKNILE